MNQKEKNLNKFCEWLSYYAIHNSFISSSDFENFRFGLEVLLSQFITFFTIFIVGIVLKEIIPTIYFLVIFISFRSLNNNFHCKTFISCFLLTNFTYILCIGIIILNMTVMTTILYLLSIVVILFCSKIAVSNKKIVFLYFLIALISIYFINEIFIIITVIIVMDIITQYYKIKKTNISLYKV